MKSPKIYYQINPRSNGMPEVPAHFPGGLAALNQFIHARSTYVAKERSVMVVTFLVNENGEVEAPKILNSVNAECDQQVLYILASMPDWTPARNAGAIVPVQVNLPIIFDVARNSVKKETSIRQRAAA
ncbi:MAG: energy transducer TonB [Saprospiraceae bacterium]|nr:energy transducer TonB [Saprospiraceae bacterium]